jgi:hypothetical protein
MPLQICCRKQRCSIVAQLAKSVQVPQEKAMYFPILAWTAGGLFGGRLGSAGAKHPGSSAKWKARTAGGASRTGNLCRLSGTGSKPPCNGRYWLSFSLAGLPINLLYSENSDGEQIISLTSKVGGSNLKGNLSRATQGFVYIFGSSIVTVSSNVS